jgi:hypothetical protein
MRFLPFVILFLCYLNQNFAQENKENKLQFSGFIDLYHAIDFNNPVSSELPGFLVNYNRHNEFNLNLGYLKAAYKDESIRGNFALMAGTYAQYNLAHEQALLRNVFEANAGYRIRKRLWIDAGVFPSHIGFESAVGADNYTLTRSIMAENTPYYLSGAKINYVSTNDVWDLTFVLVNGWQNIKETPRNTNKAIGAKITWQPSSKITVNSSTFIGNEKPDTARQMRYFHNFYLIYHMMENFSFIAAFDAGM